MTPFRVSLAREVHSVTTSQGEQISVLREVQRDIAQNITSVAPATVTLASAG